MYGVAPEVTQEVGVLLQHGDLDTGARQHQSEEQTRRAATDDRACCPVAHVASRTLLVDVPSGPIVCRHSRGRTAYRKLPASVPTMLASIVTAVPCPRRDIDRLYRW